MSSIPSLCNEEAVAKSVDLYGLIGSVAGRLRRKFEEGSSAEQDRKLENDESSYSRVWVVTQFG